MVYWGNRRPAFQIACKIAKIDRWGLPNNLFKNQLGWQREAKFDPDARVRKCVDKTVTCTNKIVGETR